MRKIRDRRTMPIDFDHMRTLHQEAGEQLELMQTALDTAEHATDIMRDGLDGMATNHWNAYLDVIHMLCMHDESMNSVLKRYALKNNELPESSDQQLSLHRPLLLSLISSLLRRHRRIEHIFSLRGNPMTEYLKDSLSMEREHMADLVSMIQSII